MSTFSLNRRQALASLGAAALSFGCNSAEPTTSDADALALLDDFAENLLLLFPEGATSLGIDIDARAGLRSRLSDRSAEGQERVASQLRTDLDRANAFDASNLSQAMRTSFEVVRSAYAVALEGFALP
jgi:uncharacterized protein (DUF885 family)